MSTSTIHNNNITAAFGSFEITLLPLVCHQETRPSTPASIQPLPAVAVAASVDETPAPAPKKPSKQAPDKPSKAVPRETIKIEVGTAQ